jgi:hypothetical protein
MNTEKLSTPIGDFEFVLGGYPTEASVQKLFDALDFQRACQAYLDFMPAMSMYSLLEGQEKGFGCKECSDLAIAADLLDATPYFLTGNTESIYFSVNIDLKKDGPTVVKIPPQVLGMANDAYFRYIVDFGMVGPDKGQGECTSCCRRIMKMKFPKDILWFVRAPTSCGLWRAPANKLAVWVSKQ